MDMYRGHKIVDSEEGWRYEATGQLVRENPNIACGVCLKPNNPEGHDACLANLPGVMNACCGHGKRSESYVQFEGGLTLRGFRICDAHDPAGSDH